LDTLKLSFLRKCELVVGREHLKTIGRDGWDSVKEFSIDWRKKFTGKPLAVCFPSSAKEVKQIVGLAIEADVKLVPQGGNTGLSGGATPDNSMEQVVVCMSRMKTIQSTDYQNRTITLQAGCTLRELQQHADDLGLFFPLDFTSRDNATVGGFLSTNAGGLAVLKYGNARSMCLGLEVVLPSGEIWNGLKGLRKDNSGYDLKNIFIGSEGTLGFITAATMTLVHKPTNKITALLVASDLNSTLNFFCDLQIKSNDQLTAFEFMTEESIKLLKKYFPNTLPGVLSKHNNCIFILIEISAFSTGSQVEDFNQTINFHDYLQDCISKEILIDGVQSGTKKRTEQFWLMRESITYASAEDGPQVKNDISIPISKIPKFVEKISKKINNLFPETRIINFGHLGDGNLHFNIAPPDSLGKGLDETQRKKEFKNYLLENEDQIRRCVHDEVLLFEGSISAEHGIGQLRKDEVLRVKSSIELKMMKQIKKSFDPLNIMNPGKVL
jgi:FAD/FMN-containing dehydrogenase